MRIIVDEQANQEKLEDETLLKAKDFLEKISTFLEDELGKGAVEIHTLHLNWSRSTEKKGAISQSLLARLFVKFYVAQQLHNFDIYWFFSSKRIFDDCHLSLPLEKPIIVRADSFSHFKKLPAEEIISKMIIVGISRVLEEIIFSCKKTLNGINEGLKLERIKFF